MGDRNCLVTRMGDRNCLVTRMGDRNCFVTRIGDRNSTAEFISNLLEEEEVGVLI